jgi:hypothetical protein
MDWLIEGDSTIDKRLEMFKKQKAAVEKQIEELKETLKLLEYKCWYYETAKKPVLARCIIQLSWRISRKRYAL